MLEMFLWGGGLMALAVSIWIAIRIVLLYREAWSMQKKIDWAHEQLQIAMDQIESDDDAKILTGLQTLSNLNIPHVRIKAMHKLAKLKQNSNPRIAMKAEATLKEISSMPQAQPESTTPAFN